MLAVLREELEEIKEKFGTPRRTELCDAEFESDIEDLIQREDMVVTITHGGYIKRVPLDTYRAQRRGGKGRSGTSLKDEDFVSDMFVASTHTPIIFFTSRGIAHTLKVWQLPLASPQSRGKALINLLPLESEENVSVYLRVPENEEIWDKLDIMLATSHGSIRRNKLTDFQNIRANGLIAMKLDEGESLVSVKIASEDEDVFLASKKGKAIRFQVDKIRVFASRASKGVRGMKLGKGDEVMSMSILKREEEGAKGQALLCVSENGMGKRTYASEYRTIGRGGQGVVNMKLSDKTGDIVATFPVTDEHQVMLISDLGQMIRMPVNTVRHTGRSTMGVRLFNVAKDEKVVSVAWLVEDDDDDGIDDAEQGDVIDAAAPEGDAKSEEATPAPTDSEAPTEE